MSETFGQLVAVIRPLSCDVELAEVLRLSDGVPAGVAAVQLGEQAALPVEA